MTLGEHLAELRGRLGRSLLAFVVAVVVLYNFREPALDFVKIPFHRATADLNATLPETYLRQLDGNDDLLWTDFFSSEEIKFSSDAEGFSWGDFMEAHRDELVVVHAKRFPDQLQSLRTTGSFVPKIRISIWLALFIAGPIFLWEMWMFVAAGLYKAERRVVYSFFPVTMALFLGGIAFGFYFMVPNAIYFLQVDGLGRDGIPRNMTLDDYMEFLRGLALAMGVVFQLPVAQCILARTGVVDPKVYGKYRGHMALIALIIAMFLTPPDPVTQMMLAGPAIILWEIGYWVSRPLYKPTFPDDDADDDATAGAEIAL